MVHPERRDEDVDLNMSGMYFGAGVAVGLVSSGGAPHVSLDGRLKVCRGV